MDKELYSRTIDALGDKTVDTISSLHFCILGCGAVGSQFAEMLVRSGATKFTLVDGDNVEKTNLNRCFAYVDKDINRKKVHALKERLLAINSSIRYQDILVIDDYFTHDPLESDLVRDSIAKAGFVLIAMDRHSFRKVAADTCRSLDVPHFMSIGIYVNNDGYRYECTWEPEIDENSEYDDGYGIGSYVSVVMQASAEAFQMMIARFCEVPTRHEYLLKQFRNFDSRPDRETIKYIKLL